MQPQYTIYLVDEFEFGRIHCNRCKPCTFLTCQVKNFPTKITSRWSLQKHLTRIVWTLSAQHSVINYPANNLAALTSNTPTKLYDDDRVGVDHYGFYNLPRKTTCGVRFISIQTRILLPNFKPIKFPKPSLFYT